MLRLKSTDKIQDVVVFCLENNHLRRLKRIFSEEKGVTG